MYQSVPVDAGDDEDGEEDEDRDDDEPDVRRGKVS
jgi:hypothetical protein